MAKHLEGLYYNNKRLWVIDFPYSTTKYIFAGGETAVVEAAKRLKKGEQKNNPYPYKIKEVTERVR